MAHETELLQRFIDSTDAIVYLKDEDGRYLLVNQRVADLLKRPKEDLIGKMDRDFFPKEEVDRFREYDRKVTETGAPASYRAMATFPGGRQITVLDHKFPVSVEGHEHALGGFAIIEASEPK
jgi:rsbT co-antagonist protein RsbR